MHAVFVACLFGGFVATVLLAALGALGAGHAHAGHLASSEQPCSEPPSCAMAALVRASTPALQGDAAVGTPSAPIRLDAPDEVL
jgi:hypothetical protein